MFKPCSILLTVPGPFFCESFFITMFHVCLCYAVLSVSCSLRIPRWERPYLLAHLCVAFLCVFVTFPYDVPDQVWYLIVSILDVCLPHDFELM